jgi:hypothetical protein
MYKLPLLHLTPYCLELLLSQLKLSVKVLSLQSIEICLIKSHQLSSHWICLSLLCLLWLTLLLDFWFDQSEFFVPHRNKILKRFGILCLFLFENNTETVEIFVKNGLRQFLLELCHFALKRVETFLDLFWVVMKSSVVKGCVIEKGKRCVVGLEDMLKD